MNYVLEKTQQWQEKELNGATIAIPEDWSTTSLSAYATILSGQSPASELVTDKGIDFHQGNSLFGNKYVEPSTKKIERTAAPKIAPAHSVLFSVRAPVGEVNIARTEMCIGRGLAALTTTHVSEWMYFRLKAMSSVFKKLSTGTTFEGITAKNLGNVTFGCPPSISEQTAIANILSDQENLVAHYNDLIALHEKRFAYLSDELLSGRLRTNIIAEHVVLTNTKDWSDDLINNQTIKFPKDWFATEFTNVLASESISTSNKVKKQDVRSTGAYLAISQEVEFSCGYSDGTALLASEYKPHILFGDHNCSLKFVTTPYVLAGDGVKVLTSKHNAKFMFFALRELQLVSSGYQRHFSQLKESIILLPPPEEQTLIAKVLSEQEALIAEYKKLRDAEQKRFDWLSDALLSGTYRVKMEA